MNKIGVAIIGCGGITLQNHLPGLALCTNTEVVALCDTNPEVLAKAQRQTGIAVGATSPEAILERDDVHAVIIATPNVHHAPVARAAVARGKHVLCEKPLAMNAEQALDMAEAADRAGVRHMTAFTYRFVPAMRYLSYLVRKGAIGQPYHFRCCRLQDWADRDLGWRQVAKMAGTGELGDMLSHRIDFSRLLLGPMRRLVAQTRRFLDQRQGRPSELEDWVGVLAEFGCGATGMLESSKLATGRNESWRSQDYLEINGSEGTFVFLTERWNELLAGKPGGAGLEPVAVPREFWAWPGSTRDLSQGDPLVTFRYDQAVEFIDAIRQGRPCVPSFHDGAKVQIVMDAILRSAREDRWVEL